MKQITVFSVFLVVASSLAVAYESQDSDYLQAVDPVLGIGTNFGRWDGTINLVYDPDGAPSLFSDPDDVLDLLEQATSEWELVSGIQFTVVGTDAGIPDDDNLDPDSQDGLVRVFWGSAGGAAGRAGPNSDFYDMDKGYYPYVDGSVELNDDDSLWDFQSELVDVLVHELGHLIGMGHSDTPDSVMYANPYNHLLHPRADDILAARSIYGNGSLAIEDVSQPLDLWLYDPLPMAAESDLEYLFKANQALDEDAFISVGNDTPVTVIDDSAQDGVFVRFNFGGVGNFSNNTDINIDATVVYVDPFGYLYSMSDAQIECDSGFACGGGWISIATSDAMKTVPGEWTVYVVDDDKQQTLLELPFLVDTDPQYNQPPVAEVTVTGVSSTVVNVSLAVTDPENDNIEVVWHPHGNLGDQDNDGFLDTEIRDAAQSGQTVDRNITFLSAETHTLYVELVDDEPRYDGSKPDSSGAGDGYQSLISITVSLPVSSDNDVTVVTSFQDAGGGSDSGSQVVDAIADSATLKTITTSDRSATTAAFGAGATSDNGDSTATDFTSGDSVTIAGSVIPQAEDVGEEAEIFVVLYVTLPSFLDVDGVYNTWNGDLKILGPAYEISSLGSQENFEVFSGTVQSGLYRVFLGYRLTSGGPIHFNASAFRVNVD